MDIRDVEDWAIKTRIIDDHTYLAPPTASTCRLPMFSLGFTLERVRHLSDKFTGHSC